MAIINIWEKYREKINPFEPRDFASREIIHIAQILIAYLQQKQIWSKLLKSLFTTQRSHDCEILDEPRFQLNADVWLTSTKTDLWPNSLINLHKVSWRAARIIAGSRYDTSAVPSIKSHGWQTIEELICNGAIREATSDWVAAAPQLLSWSWCFSIDLVQSYVQNRCKQNILKKFSI